MQLNSWFRAGLAAGLAVSLTACSYISGLFPDKQKQYRYSSELPELEIPPELSASQLAKSGATNSQAQELMDKYKPEGGSASPPPAKKKASAAKRKDSESVLAQSGDDDAALIEIHESYAETWNDVSRALGRMRVEITDQNRQDGVFYVYYGGVAPKKPSAEEEETGFWDGMKNLFKSDGDTAKEYRVKLEDKDDYTHVKVLDQNGKGVSEGPGLDLLKRLHQKLTTLHMPEPEGEEARKAADAEKQATEKAGKQ